MKIYFHANTTPNPIALRNLAEHFGIASELVDASDGAALVSEIKSAIDAGEIGHLLDVDSLAGICDQVTLARISRVFEHSNAGLLLLTTAHTDSIAIFLETLTYGTVRGTTLVYAAHDVTFPDSPTGLSGALRSHSLPRKQGDGLGLTVAHECAIDVVMTLANTPSFVRVHRNGLNIFVWSTFRVFDILTPLTSEKEFEDAADEFTPVIIFLRAIFGDHCWHNPNIGAGIVIDDPLLRKRYGFIDFPKLLASARREQYHVTLAFIPWNHWRTRVSDARLFLDYADSFSICAHGCDHTKSEFASNDYDGLLRRTVVAKDRMERHRQRTGLRCDPLMVCPQEQYSLQAMHALSDGRQFIALVNTSCVPRNLTAHQLRGADLLLPAQDAFFGLPVFKRHYWKDMPALAMGLFLGKPAILVEHHEFFRDGVARAEEFVRKLANLRPNLKWTSLIETATTTHLQRRVSQDKREIRFFTDSFQFTHRSVEQTSYRLLRRVSESAIVQRVDVNGEDIPFVRDEGFVTFGLLASEPKQFNIQIEITPVRPTGAYSSGIKYQTLVALRRALSEFRDNIVSRSDFALATGKSLMKFLGQTGG